MNQLFIADILIHFIWIVFIIMPGIADRDCMLEVRERKELERIKEDYELCV